MGPRRIVMKSIEAIRDVFSARDSGPKTVCKQRMFRVSVYVIHACWVQGSCILAFEYSTVLSLINFNSKSSHGKVLRLGHNNSERWLQSRRHDKDAVGRWSCIVDRSGGRT